MRVRFICKTRYKGKSREVNDIINISDASEAVRLADSGIVNIVKDEDGNEDGNEDDANANANANANENSNEYEGMKAKDLYALCIEKGLDVEPKQSKDVYIAALVSNEAN